MHHGEDAAMTPPASDHFNGKKFFYPGFTAQKGFSDLLRWKFTSHPARWPRRVEIASKSLAPPPPASGGVEATWIGQSTFLLRTASAAILTDPIFSERASPISWTGPRRVTEPGVTFDALPRIDLVLLSHDHYDHCDLPTLRRLARRDNPLVLAPLGHGTLLAGAGVGRVVELDWWESRACDHGVEATLVPSLHWCRRAPFQTNRRLWGGYMVSCGGRRIYFMGDSAYNQALFRGIRQRLGTPDLALIPIGAYEPEWFMHTAHMNPAEAVQAHLDLGSRRSVAMHWGTFQLSDEGRDDPVRALERARNAAAVGLDAFSVPGPGDALSV
jgi:L-ascorbate metabolism protein UlaG (beta-lactamase superfamily)